MNLIEHYVLEVLGAPESHITSAGTKYFTVECKVDCYGNIRTEKVLVFTIEEAEAIKPGYMYLA